MQAQSQQEEQVNDWKMYADAAAVDIGAALSGSEEGALEHLRDALGNLRQAIELKEDE